MSHTRRRRVWIGGAAVVATVAGSLAASPVQALQGTAADATAYTYTARLVLGKSDRACTGTLVDPRWVLSAASCFADATGSVPSGNPRTSTTVTVGRSDLTQTTVGATRTAVELVPHPDRDLIMVKLNLRVTNVKPAALAAAPAVVGETVRAAGFGRTKTTWVPDKLHTASFTAAGDGSANVGLTASGDAVICQGDTGGPILRETGGTQELLAVTSRSWQGGCLGTPPTETRTGATATRVDDIRPWIRNTAFAAQGDLTGDKIADLAAVWNDGTLHTYSGKGDGQLNSQVPQLGGTTWSTIKHVVKDDFTGDGIADLMAVWNDGTLHIYTGKGDGQLNNGVTVAQGGNTWATIKQAAAGDFTGDGIADLMAVWNDGTLHIYTGRGDGQLNNGVTVAQGGNTWATVKQMTAGDFTGDGIADLMAVWNDGSLHSYSGKGDGQLNSQVPQLGGTTWSTMKHVTAGDFTGDGIADLMAVWNDGTLHVYTGKGDGQVNNGVTVAQGGNTWGTTKQMA
ncbi:FG-GAP-like repeat-containing protein [Streptomyces sp. NPDC093546]|uniref:FG-GAP-like repeat-containing protein n=1 Tax=Streptomyces sp. NPDC093546 TaxID=3366040 RepID=UPI00380FB7E9